MYKNIHFAVWAGCCASGASIFGKLSGLPPFQDFLALKILFFGLMLLCNAGVWTLFVKALHQNNSSLVATVLSTASNFVLSGVVGFVIFDETTSISWWIGLYIIIVGLLLVLRGDASQLPEEIKED
ncbi:transmembrane protein 42 [Aethina tumida]|uniref:transmembrane protein 42 n=1 Tax=Aethina tumida TaxID=116153 RepID=UPI00096AE09F|nr:transmembrane protein 42 [Aethina tumida]